MDSFDKKLKDLFENQESNIPEGYGWKDNKSAIYDKMNTKKDRDYLIWVMLGSYLSIMLVLIWLPVSANTSLSSDTTTLLVENEIKKQSPINNESPHNTSTESDTKKTTPIGSVNVDNNSDAKNNFRPIASDNSSTNNSDHYVGFNHHKHSKPNLLEKSNENASEVKETTITHVDIEETVENILPAKTTHTTLNIAEPISILNSKLIHLERTFTGKQPTKKQELDPTLSNPLFSMVSVSTGTLIDYMAYNSAAPARAYMEAKPGYYLDLNYAKQITDSWAIHLGLSHEFGVEFFNFQSQDTVSVFTDQLVTHEVTNALTGSVERVLGSAEYDSSRNRNFQTYNTYRRSSASIIIAKRIFLSSNWEAWLGGGSQYSFHVTTNGYGLDKESEVVQFPIDIDIHKKQNLSLRSYFNLRYRLTDSWGIGVQSSLAKSLTDWNTRPEIIQKPWSLQLGLSMQYRWE